MKTIESHIARDKDILDDPSTNPQMRRHIEVELHELEDYVDHHKEEIEAGDHLIQMHLSYSAISIQRSLSV